MKTSILVLSIIGAVLSIIIGLFTAGIMQIGEEGSPGAKYFFLGMVQGVLGLIGGIKGYRHFDEERRSCITAGVLLIIAAILFVHNTFQIFSGILFAIAGILVLVAGGKQIKSEPSSTQRAPQTKLYLRPEKKEDGPRKQKRERKGGGV
jgi:predicted membrane protein